MNYLDSICTYGHSIDCDRCNATVRVALEDLDRYEEAIASFQNALKDRPDDYWSWYRQGDALRQLGRYHEAIASYDRALESRPDDYWSWYRRGDVLRHWGRLEAALASYDKALEVKPTDYWSWYQRGEVLRQLGRYRDAVISYDKVLESQPEDEYAWYNKACCYALRGLAELAIASLQEAIYLNADEYQELAKTDPDFDNLRGNEQFQALIFDYLPLPQNGRKF